MNKICSECNQSFPKQITVEGKKYILKNRKKCLNCVPFKSKNGTGQLYSNWTEERKARHRAVAAAKGLKRKRLLLEYKGGKCEICGYNKCPKALHFHHRNPSEKLFELCTSGIRSKSWDLILKEADKCDLVCSNCHCEIHDAQFADYINVELKTIPGEGIKDFPCQNCGKNRKHKSPNNLCKKCSSERQRRVERPGFDILLKQIKELGYKGTGQLYGVSDNTIRKWVKRGENSSATHQKFDN
jgi:hypothetical protein